MAGPNNAGRRLPHCGRLPDEGGSLLLVREDPRQ